MSSIVSGAVDAVREKVLTKPREPEDWLKADEVEQVAEDEATMIEEIGQTMRRIQLKNFDAHGHYYRGTHVKSLAFVKGTLKVSPDLPKHLRQGIFQSATSYPVIARYANEPSFVKADTENAPRGLGLKVFDVPGQPLSKGDDDYTTSTQDFLFNNAPMVELTDVRTTLEIQQIRERNFDNAAGLAAELAKRSDRSKQMAPGMLPNEYVIGTTMYSQAAFAYGPYAAKYSLAPKAPRQAELAGKTIPSDASSTFHRDHLRGYFASNAATYSFRVQFTSDLSTHPVEDASVPWDEVMAPWREVGEITFDPQDSFSDARRVWWEDQIALSPWNGITDHRPLGGINRLRKRVYEFTREGRERNGMAVRFPKSVDEFPE